MEREHGQALQALMPAHVKSHLQAPAQPETESEAAFPYVNIYLAPRAHAERLSSSANRIDWYVTTICVGLDTEQLAWLRDRVVAGLARRRPVVAGRTCSLIEHTSSTPASQDPDIPGHKIFIATDWWRFSSTAA